MIICSLKRESIFEKIAVFNSDYNFGNHDSLNKEVILSFKNGKLCACLIHKDKTLTPFELEIVNYITDFDNRIHGIIDSSVLQEKTITILGLGSGGGKIALDLTRSGAINLILVDKDIVSVSNICRSVFNLNDISKKKTEAILEKLLSVNPFINVLIHNEDILKMDNQKLLDIIEQSDLIIEATDSVQTKILINGLAHNLTPVLYPSVYAYGTGGDILITMQGLPCFECCFRNILEQMKDSEKREWDYSGDQAKPMPGLISDIQVICNRTVKLALAILMDDSNMSFFEKVTEPGKSLLLIGNERNVSVFEEPFGEIWAEVTIEPECICQTLC